MVRFLKPEEYGKTRALCDLCFQDEAFSREYYETERKIEQNRVAVKEIDGEIVAMAQVAPRKALVRGVWQDAPYILGVCTAPAHRHRGYMDELLQLICETLRVEGAPWTFLIAVDQAIYRHLGFVYDWAFSEEEAALLEADEGLTECSAKLLCAECFEKPEKII